MMNIQKAMHLTINDAIQLIGLDRSEITEHTYIYLAEDGMLWAIEKPDHTADPEDEIFSLGYAQAYEEYAEVTVQEAADMKQVSVQAVRDVLRDTERRAAIFPNAHRFGSVERGEWRIPMQEVLKWQPRRRGAK